jgi:hypothetical protein
LPARGGACSAEKTFRGRQFTVVFVDVDRAGRGDAGAGRDKKPVPMNLLIAVLHAVLHSAEKRLASG